MLADGTIQLQNRFEALELEEETRELGISHPEISLGALNVMISELKASEEKQELRISRLEASYKRRAKRENTRAVHSLLATARQKLFECLTGSPMESGDEVEWNNLIDKMLNQQDEMVISRTAMLCLKYGKKPVQKSRSDVECMVYSKEQHAIRVEGLVESGEPKGDALREIFRWVHGVGSQDIFSELDVLRLWE